MRVTMAMWQKNMAWIVSSLMTPSILVGAMSHYSRHLNREEWLQHRESVSGWVFGALLPLCGFVLAPLGLLGLLIYGVLLQRRRRVGTDVSRWQVYLVWLCLTLALAAYLVFFDYLRWALLEFGQHR
jgi:hypothetical protein